MSSFSSDRSLSVLAFLGVFAFVSGRMWHEAFALQGGIPFYNFLFYGFSLAALGYITFRSLALGGEFRRRYSVFFFALSVLVSFLLIFVFYQTDSFSSLNKGDFGAMYFGYVVSSISYAVLGYLAFIFLRSFSENLVLVVLVFAVLPIFIITDWANASIVFRDYATGQTVNYLLMGDMLVFSFFLYFCATYSRASLGLNHYVVVAFLFVALFLNNSRSSLIVFSLSFLSSHFLISLSSKIVRIRLSVFLMFSFSLLIIFFIFFWAELEVLFKASRVFSLFLNSGDGSLASRSLIMDAGIRRIFDNFMLGDIGGQIKNAYGIAPLGSYIHNILSYWEQFGFVVFCIYVFSWIFLLNEIVKGLRLDPVGGVALLFGFSYALLSVVFARAFVHTIFSSFFVFLAFQASALVGISDKKSEKWLLTR